MGKHLTFVFLFLQLSIPALFKTLKCDFDHDFCDWRQKGEISAKWEIVPGIPGDDTPFARVNDASTGDGEGDTVVLISPIVSAKHHCLTFRYQIEGNDSVLIVYLMQSAESWPIHFIPGSNDSPSWMTVSIPIHSAIDFQIVIEANVKNSHLNIIGIDDIVISESTCMQIYRGESNSNPGALLPNKPLTEPSSTPSALFSSKPLTEPECEPSGLFSADNKFFHLVKEKLTQPVAEQTCKELGGHLALITTKKAMDTVILIAKEFRKDVWVAGYLNRTTHKWQTGPHGDIMTFPKNWWSPGEPNDFLKGRENCLLVKRRTTMEGLNDASCDRKKFVLCENVTRPEDQ